MLIKRKGKRCYKNNKKYNLYKNIHKYSETCQWWCSQETLISLLKDNIKEIKKLTAK